MAACSPVRSVAGMSTTSIQDHREQLLAGLPLAERRIELAGVSTAVLEGGDGPAVVLLHGPAGNATHWMRVVSELATTHRVVVPDLPGHGASFPVDGEFDAVAWLGELIAHSCPEPPSVVGYALGGAIAARFAAAHGDAVAGLVLVDTLGLTDFDPAPEFGVALHAYLAEPSEATHDELWRHCARDLDAVRAAIDWEAFRAYNVDCAHNPAVLGGLMAGFGGAADFSAIATPTALIWGRHDAATRLSVAEAAALRHGWPLHVIEDCADDPPVEQPAAFLSALRAALGVHALAATGFGGEIVDRGHPRYDELRRVFNGMVDRRPALIARCPSAADVSAAVGVARRHGLPVSVYAGGHNVTGNAVRDDALMIDLRPMKGIEIDPAARTCRAGGGLTWGEFDAATQQHGLAVTGGRASTTGLGGLVLGGGSGWLERKCGYAVDNLLSVEIVTADGRILTASEREHPDLFWATRGGGGNFGVVTSMELRLHPVGPTVLGGMLRVSGADGRRRAAQLPRRDGRGARRGRLRRRAGHGAGRAAGGRRGRLPCRSGGRG